MGPHAVRKQWCKRCQDQYDGVGQGWQAMSSVARLHCASAHLSYATSHPPAYAAWPKSSFITITNEVQPRQLASDFTFGPGGHLYVSLSGGVGGDEGGGRIVRITRTGEISMFFDPGFPPLNCALGGIGVDFDAIRFNTQGVLFIGGREGTTGPPNCPQSTLIWKLQDGILSTNLAAFPTASTRRAKERSRWLS